MKTEDTRASGSIAPKRHHDAIERRFIHGHIEPWIFLSNGVDYFTFVFQ